MPSISHSSCSSEFQGTCITLGLAVVSPVESQRSSSPEEFQSSSHPGPRENKFAHIHVEAQMWWDQCSQSSDKPLDSSTENLERTSSTGSTGGNYKVCTPFPRSCQSAINCQHLSCLEALKPISSSVT